MAVFVLASADPTPVIVALTASHLIAPVDFLGSKATVGAPSNIILPHIFTKFLVANAVARDARMTYGATFEAHLLFAGATRGIA